MLYSPVSFVLHLAGLGGHGGWGVPSLVSHALVLDVVWCWGSCLAFFLRCYCFLSRVLLVLCRVFSWYNNHSFLCLVVFSVGSFLGDWAIWVFCLHLFWVSFWRCFVEMLMVPLCFLCGPDFLWYLLPHSLGCSSRSGLGCGDIEPIMLGKNKN